MSDTNDRPSRDGSESPTWTDADRRWADAAARQTQGDALQPAAQAHLRDHVPTDGALRAEQALRAAMADIASRPDDDDALIAGALDRHFADASPATPDRARWKAPAAALLAVAAVATVWFVGGTGSKVPTVQPAVVADAGPAAPAPSPAPRPDTALAAAADGPAPWLHLDGQTATRPWTEPELRAKERQCIGRSGAKACLDPGAAIRRTEQGLELLVGRLEFATAGHRVELKVANTLVVGETVQLVASVDAKGQGRIEVTEGELASRVEASAVPVVQAGGVGQGTSHARSRRVPPIDDLLRTARSLRQSGDHRGATKVLEDAVKHYPRNSKARTALATLGQIYLGPLRKPARALKWFDRYLATPGGSLREEVEYGRIRALRAMGRGADAERARRAFLQAHPTSSYRAALSTEDRTP